MENKNHYDQLCALGSQRWSVDIPPLLTIDCRTYNHVKFISKAIEGFLMQRTSFSVEILIHDDASTDGTAEIVKEYADKYPNLIKATFQVENQYRKYPKTDQYIEPPPPRGKYIAKCEGDDYWEDEDKIQKQVQFLEANPDYVITYHDAKVINEDDQVIHKSRLASNAYTYITKTNPNVDKRDFSNIELMMGARILLLTACYRNVLSSRPDEAIRSFSSDRWLTVLLGEYGHGKYMGHIIKPAVYRRHKGGVSYDMVTSDVKKQREIKLKIFMSFVEMFLYHARTKDCDFAIDFFNNTVFKLVRDLRPDDNAVDRELLRFKESYVYKIGLLVTYIPRKLRDFLVYIKKRKLL